MDVFICILALRYRWQAKFLSELSRPVFYILVPSMFIKAMFPTPVSDVFEDRLSVSRTLTHTSVALLAVALQTSKPGTSTSSTSYFSLLSYPLSSSAPSMASAGHFPFFVYRCLWGSCACFIDFPVMEECSWPSLQVLLYPFHRHTARASPESRRWEGTAVTLQKLNRDDFEARGLRRDVIDWTCAPISSWRQLSIRCRIVLCPREHVWLHTCCDLCDLFSWQ